MNSEKIMALADALYQRGYYDRRQGRDYDPRGSEEWQSVVDALTQQPESGSVCTVCDNDGLHCNTCGFDPEAKQPESEPVKWCGDRGHRNHYLKTGEQCTCRYKFVSKIPLYTSPQPTPQVPEYECGCGDIYPAMSVSGQMIARGGECENCEVGSGRIKPTIPENWRAVAVGAMSFANTRGCQKSPLCAKEHIKGLANLILSLPAAPSTPEKREPKGVQKSKLEFLKGRADYISNRDEWVIRVAFEGRRHCLLDRFGRVVWLENASDAGPLRPQPAALPEDAIEQMAEAGARDSLPQDGMFSSEQLDYMRGERLPAYRKLAKLMLDAAGIPIVAPPVPDKPKPSHYAVLNTQGEIQFSMAVDGSLPENQVVDMMHQHINEAIDGDVEGAGSWVVRAVTVSSVSSWVVRAVTASSVSSMAGGE